MGKGFAEAKIISPEVMRAIMERLRDYAACKPIFARDYRFVDVASQTGLRISEVAHLKREDVLSNGLIVTRRKKKILIARPIKINPVGLARIREYASMVPSGYIFPGNAGACFIHRRPRFLIEDCPECGEKVAPLSMVKKKCDRISLFFRHLSGDHKKSFKEIEAWITASSVQVTDQFCKGGHVSIRAFAKRWQNLMKDLRIYMPGRGVHSVRHAAITRMYDTTRDIMATRAFAGHESIEMTRNYTHIDEADQVAKLPVDW